CLENCNLPRLHDKLIGASLGTEFRLLGTEFRLLGTGHIRKTLISKDKKPFFPPKSFKSFKSS
ncbi:TPA: hypothetical protein ACKP8D_006163, partial [Pseudomonas putida]